MKDIAIPPHPQLTAIIQRVYAKALRAAEKALAEPHEPEYDGSGDQEWNHATVRVRAGLMLAGKAMDHDREADVGHRQFGLLVLRERIKDHREWEQQAAMVDASTPPVLTSVQTTTIDAEVVSPVTVPEDK